MFAIEKTNYFLKKAKKLVDKNRDLLSKILKTVDILAQNPKNPTLKSHKVVTPKFGICISSRVSGDIRIVWRFKNGTEIEILELLDIGGHSGSSEVY